MDNLREGIGLRAYAQKDPLIEYKREGMEMFQNMIDRVKEDVVKIVFRVRGSWEDAIQKPRPASNASSRWREERRAVTLPVGGPAEPEPDQGEGAGILARPRGGGMPQMPRGAMPNLPPAEKITPIRRATPKVGRNDPCPCGSGKKYKKCHGAGEA